MLGTSRPIAFGTRTDVTFARRFHDEAAGVSLAVVSLFALASDHLGTALRAALDERVLSITEF